MQRKLIGAVMLWAAAFAFRTFFPEWSIHYLGGNRFFILLVFIAIGVLVFGEKVELKYYAVPLLVVLGLYLLRDTLLPGLNLGSSSASTYYAAASSQPRCNQTLQTVTVGSSPIVINPRAQYFVLWGVEPGGSRVNLLSASGKVIRTVGSEPNNVPEFFESIQAAGGGTATIHYLLVTC